VVRTLTPNPVAAHPESGCTTNDAATLGAMLPLCVIEMFTLSLLLTILIPACDVPNCCMQKLDEEVPDDRLTVCVCHALGF
jgi:hypothetical protein